MLDLELKKDHFAFEVIENLIGDPPTDGEQWLRIAAYNFKCVLPCKLTIDPFFLLFFNKIEF